MKVDRESEIELLKKQEILKGEYVKESKPVREKVVEKRIQSVLYFWMACIVMCIFYIVLNAENRKILFVSVAVIFLAFVLISLTTILGEFMEARDIHKRGKTVEARFLCTTEAIRGKKWLWYEFELEDGRHICAGNQCRMFFENGQQEETDSKRIVWYAKGQYDTVADSSFGRILKEYMITIISDIIVVLIALATLWMAGNVNT